MVFQIVLSVILFSLAAADLVWFIVEEVKWHRHKEDIVRIYKPGGAESVRGCRHFYQIVMFVLFFLFGLFCLP